MKKILFGLVILASSFLFAQDTANSESGKSGGSLSGTPRIMRKSTLGTEVFFTNLNRSYFIPFDEQHNSKFEAINRAMSSGVSIGFRADPVSRRILSVSGQKAKESLADSVDEPAEAPKKAEATKSPTPSGSPPSAPNK